ncbi:MAG: pseudouridine-5'-phosphate glycosidase [Planctomycetes bacterium]|nr:pseudouridine-5'-phosphate glycosidase [Planctomycetota bacterium]
MTVTVSAEVREALHDRRPVVALESAVLTHGLPRDPLDPALAPDDAAWNHDGPTNMEAMRAMLRAVRDGGAVPAAIAVIDGALTIGADADALAHLAADDTAGKVATTNLAHVIAAGASAGTTVSATLTACRSAGPEPIRVLATGGIGGVHPGFGDRPDVSADLPELARTPACVVCSGAKSILDGPATLEVLEMLGVPVVGYGTDACPRFHARRWPGLTLSQRVDDPPAAARLCHAQWDVLGLRRGIVLASPVPEAYALDDAELDAALEAAERSTRARGAARTPELLSELVRTTRGRSLRANIALLVANARLAAQVAGAL